MTVRPTSGGEVDPYLYLDPPLLDASGLLALGHALLDCAPVNPPAALGSALRRMRQACDELQQVSRSARDATSTPSLQPRLESRQPVDFAVDTAWTALYERLRAYVMLPELEYPRAKRASELLRILFPDALAFLRLPYEAEWAEGERRLRSVEQLKLAPDLDALAGGEFLAEVRRTHELYSRVLGRRPDSAPTDRPRDAGASGHTVGGGHGPAGHVGHAGTKDREGEINESPIVRELRFNLARCISAYAVKILALGNEDTRELKDTKDGKDIRRWLAPLSAYQRAEHRRIGAPQGGSAAAPNASALRATDVGGEPRRLGESGSYRSLLGTGGAAGPAHAPQTSAASLRESARDLPRDGNRDLAHASQSSTGGGIGQDHGLGGASGMHRPVTMGESGLFRPVKRPPSSENQ